MTGINRNIAKKVQYLLAQLPCVAIIGARQTGKRFVAKQLFADWKHMDLEQPEEQQQIAHDSRFFFENYPNRVILDEAQKLSFQTNLCLANISRLFSQLTCAHRKRVRFE